jgi:hypothetical protein
VNTYNLAGGRYIKSGYPGSMRGRFSRYFGPGTGEPRRGRESLKGPIALAIDVLFLFIFFFFFFFFFGGGAFSTQISGLKQLFRLAKFLLEALRISILFIAAIVVQYF